VNTVLKNMEELMEQARRSKKKTIGVVAAEDEDVLEAVKTAVSANIARAILIGDEGKIKNLIEKIQLASAEIEIINQPVPQKAALQALDLFHSRKIDLLMKGDITTGTFLRVLLNKENGVRTDKILSHVGVFEVDGVDKLMYLSDAAINIKPDIQEKVDICKNAIYVAHCLGNTEPNLALITPFERVELDSIPSSVDAALIAKMGDCGQIKGAKIDPKRNLSKNSSSYLFMLFVKIIFGLIIVRYLITKKMTTVMVLLMMLTVGILLIMFQILILNFNLALPKRVCFMEQLLLVLLPLWVIMRQE